MRKGRMRLLAVMVMFVMLLSFMPARIIHAADPVTTPLVDASAGGSFNVTLTCGGVDLYSAADPVINYGDPIVCQLDWSLPNTFELYPNDVLTYDLPANMNFASASGTIEGRNHENLGTYSISGNKISIIYTSSGFCSGQERIGHLAFNGTVDADPNPAADPDDIVVRFPGMNDLTLKVQHRPTPASLDIDKTYDVIDDSRHIYEWRITITATGNQSNIAIEDTMWPGMELIGDDPKVFVDYGCTTEYQDCTAFDFTDSTRRTFSGTINHMNDGQTLYLVYDVKVADEMYDLTAGKAYVAAYTGQDNYYPSGYNGVVPNRVTVRSTEAPDPVIRTTDIYGAGYAFVKWYAKPVGGELERGILRWQLFVNKIRTPNITEGYIIDTLPANLSFDINDVVVYDGDVYNARNVTEYLDITTTAIAGGATEIRFEFKDPLIAELYTINKGFYIEYTTHVERQTADRQQYINSAELFYNGTTQGALTADVYYDKPREVLKVGEYTPVTAPYANYVIVVNQAAMDLDPNSNTLTLTDTLPSALDLDTNTIKIDGQDPAPGTVSYVPSTRTLTITLDDERAYRVTYSARVNLISGARLDSSNATNNCALTGIISNGADDSVVINSRVHDSAASSSSTLGLATYNIIKHDESSATDVLPGATFRIAEAVLNGSDVTAVNTVTTDMTDANGRISFDSLTRGLCYMITETAAPSGYELDDTLRFVIFAVDASSVYPATVNYNGSEYPVTVIDYTRASVDEYIGNTPESSSGSTTTPAVSGGSQTPTPSGSSTVTTTPTPQTTVTTTVTPTLTPSPTPDLGTRLAGDGRTTDTPTPTPTVTPTATPAASGNGVVSTGEGEGLFETFGMLLVVLSAICTGMSLGRRSENVRRYKIRTPKISL